ncbi:hypothetical protein M0805_008814 [Coniferiporia weirii]|nr:hypothetical protein M0805_008814 [Coniferiporia weirii]
MLRGEKRATPADGVGATASAGPAQKKQREKMPDFDWSADNYALTWRLVDELRKPENKNVLFPDQEGMAMKTGDTKEDVYRRIAKVVHPEAFSQDPQTAGSRMKNKNVAMWKEYSGYCRRLLELCTSHRATISASGPDDSCPPEIHSEWRKIVISMPVFSVLRTFMPVRPEEKPKAPTTKPHTPRVPQTGYSQTVSEDDQSVDHLREAHSSSFSGPVPSPSMHKVSVVNDMAVGAVEGQHTNNVQEPQVYPRNCITLAEYLELRRSYQEDVRLGIFTPAEAKSRIDALDKQRVQMESSGIRPNHATPASRALSPTFAGPTISQSPAPPQRHTSVSAPDHVLEHMYEERALLLGFRKPMPPHPLARLSFKELFKTILDHATECDLQECRLDNHRKLPELGFVKAAHPNELGMPVEIVIMTRTGPVPLLRHAPAACARFMSRGTVPIMEIPLVIHSSNGWETTLWDHANATVAASLRRPLSIEEIKTVQTNTNAITTHPNYRQQFQLLNENSTFFDLLRNGLLCGNSWAYGNANVVTADDVVEQVSQH